MKKNVYAALVLMALCGGASAELLIGWDGGIGSVSAVNATGISGSLFNGGLYGVDAAKGSTDGTFGPSISGASTAATCYSVRTATPGSTDKLGIQIVNGTGSDLRLDSLVFDFGRWFANSPQDVTITYAYGDLALSNNTAVETVTGFAAVGILTDYTDVEISLLGLSDRILADGQKATFNLVTSNAGTTTAGSGFDNVGFTGSVIPEPATLGLMGMIGAGVLVVRRFALI